MHARSRWTLTRARSGCSRTPQLTTVGHAVNPVLVKGQIEGGVIQGVGMAFMEDVQYHHGLRINNTWTDYKVPTMADAPDVTAIIARAACPGGSSLRDEGARRSPGYSSPRRARQRGLSCGRRTDHVAAHERGKDLDGTACPREHGGGVRETAELAMNDVSRRAREVAGSPIRRMFNMAATMEDSKR